MSNQASWEGVEAFEWYHCPWQRSPSWYGEVAHYRVEGQIGLRLFFGWRRWVNPEERDGPYFFRVGLASYHGSLRERTFQNDLFRI